MCDVKKLARVVVIGVFVYFLLRFGIDLIYGAVQICALPATAATQGYPAYVMLASALVMPMGLGGLILYLAKYKTAAIVERIVGAEEAGDSKAWWVPAAFRLAAMIAGFLFLNGGIWRLINLVTTTVYFRGMRTAPPSYWGERFDSGFWGHAIGCTILLAAGIYLVLGAPRFVRWHVRKIVKQCKDIEQQAERGY